MQPSATNLGKTNTPTINTPTQERKAVLGAAFRWVPVLLAFMLSTLCIVFLLNVHPTSASSSALEDSSRSPLQANTIPASLHQNQEVHTGISSVFTKEVRYWEEEIIHWAGSYQLDPNLVAVVMQIESCGHPKIESKSGAKGLFQVMPFHFSSNEDPFVPDTNAQRGLSYLSKALNIAMKDPALALAGYNGGHSVIGWDPLQWSDETKRYVYWGSGILKDIAHGNSQSPRLKEWLQAGGTSLCRHSSDALGL